MSVINKMLRDLDRRQSSAPQTARLERMPSLRAGTASVASAQLFVQDGGAGRSYRWYWMILIAVVLAGTAALWQAGYVEFFLVNTPQAPSSTIAAPAPAPAPAPILASPQANSVALPAPTFAPAPAPEVVEPLRAPVPVPPATAANSVLRIDAELNGKAKTPETEKPAAQKPVAVIPAAKVPLVVSAVPAPATAPIPQPDTVQVAQRQQQQAATKDAIAHAQSLWNAGSHDAAIELMQEVLASAERSATAAPTAANVQLLGQMVRELTRMQLMESRPAPVLELLTRLEPVLGNQADLWAVRANAAQRLGRHQDSVHAYMTALQSRPNEQRWLLGAAVSLAALGQTASAADMATKARAVGVISKDVQAYLRQMGVPVND